MTQSVLELKRGASVGRIVVDVIVENYEDRLRADRGEIPAADIRRITVPALVDSGATFFCLPKSVVVQLGLTFLQEKESRTVTGPIRLGVFAPARLEVQGRDCVTQQPVVKVSPLHCRASISLARAGGWIAVMQPADTAQASYQRPGV